MEGIKMDITRFTQILVHIKVTGHKKSTLYWFICLYIFLCLSLQILGWTGSYIAAPSLMVLQVQVLLSPPGAWPVPAPSFVFPPSPVLISLPSAAQWKLWVSLSMMRICVYFLIFLFPPCVFSSCVFYAVG